MSCFHPEGVQRRGHVPVDQLLVVPVSWLGPTRRQDPTEGRPVVGGVGCLIVPSTKKRWTLSSVSTFPLLSGGVGTPSGVVRGSWGPETRRLKLVTQIPLHLSGPPTKTETLSSGPLVGRLLDGLRPPRSDRLVPLRSPRRLSPTWTTTPVLPRRFSRDND